MMVVSGGGGSGSMSFADRAEMLHYVISVQ